MPRVGYFSTPAFFANWATNNSNQHRDTLNQALIVGIGRSINPVDKGTSTVLDNGKDGQHSDPTSPCYSCHQTMDPMRNVFRQAYTYSYHAQHDPTQVFSTASFDYLGKKAPLASFDDFASALVTHPLYPVAWAQKLCTTPTRASAPRTTPSSCASRRRSPNRTTTFTSWCSSSSPRRWSPGRTTTKTWRDAGGDRQHRAPGSLLRRADQPPGPRDQPVRRHHRQDHGDGRGQQHPPGRLPARRRGSRAVDVGDPVLTAARPSRSARTRPA